MSFSYSSSSYSPGLFPSQEQEPKSTSTTRSHDEDNLIAQQAAAEAIAISRSTLSTTLIQGEQLQHCDDLRIRSEYVINKSNRLIRGMTFTGWVANIFSKDVEPPPSTLIVSSSNSTSNSASTTRNINSEYDKNEKGEDGVQKIVVTQDIDDSTNQLKLIPSQLINQASLVNNYNCNVIILKQCYNQACLDICNDLEKKTKESLYRAYTDMNMNTSSMNVHESDEIYIDAWKQLNQKFLSTQELHHGFIQNSRKAISSSKNNINNNMTQQMTHKSNSIQSNNDIIHNLAMESNKKSMIDKYQKQEEHLNILASNMNELLHNGSSIAMSLQEQNELLDTLNDGTDELKESTKMVARKAVRVTYRSMWGLPKSDFKCTVIIQHIPSQKYLTIEPHHNNKLTLQPIPHPDASVFEVHERKGGTSTNQNDDKNTHKIIGFLNKCSRTWIGHSTFMSSVVCSAKKFGRNEEWELDDGIMHMTKILCVSANWNNGGWLLVDEEAEYFSFVGFDAASKKKASLWSIIVLPPDEIVQRSS